MKKFCAIFALFCVVFLFAACGGGSKENVYGDTETSDSTSDKTDSDTTDTNSDDADSQSDSTADTTPDNGDSADNSDSDKPDSDNPDTTPDGGDTAPDNGDSADDADTSNPTDDADSSDSQSDDDADTSHGNEPEVGDTREAGCTGLPANASWNTVSSITQTWNGNEWTPSTEAVFSTTSSSTKCRFVCNQNYEWNDSECVAGTRTANCEGLPENAVWNGAASITQTWDDENWVPSNTGTYNKTPNSSECRFQCAVNYNWTGSQCVAATIQTDCTGLPENALWNTVSNITQSWSGTAWTPSEVGTFDETPSSNECRFVCKTNYSWNGVVCAPDEMNAVACTGKPENAVWNSVSNITQTWNGTEWVPTTSATFNETPSTTECRFKCAENYEWNNSRCAAGTREANCTGLPENAQWNSATNISQTWNGNAWIPSNTGSYNTSASDSECRFKCNEHYTWDGNICAADTQPATCTGLPENASWNSVSSITQTWDGNGWSPSTVATYSTTPSNTKCRFICNQNYSWNGSECVADTKTATCQNLPQNAVWNSVSNITQTWNGTEWIPSNVGSFNTEASSTECRFKCEENYNWNNSQCVAATVENDCTGLPDNAIWNTVSSITQTWNGSAWTPATNGTYNEIPSYSECRFVCKTNYSWNGISCAPDEIEAVACTGKPKNAVWNTVSTITQTWNGTEWIPSTSAIFSETPSTTECRFKCAENYNWSGAQCLAGTREASCTGLPTNAVWNTVTKIMQTWDGSEWIPSNTGSYNSTASDSECYFKCNEHYSWNGTICAAETQPANCTGLPEHASWNSVSEITQTWVGNGWAPSNAGTYNTSASTTECRFKCNENYSWNSSTSTCDADSQVSRCTGLPEHASWNTASSINQTWNGNAWIPSNIGSFNTEASSSECHFKCNEHYTWNPSNLECAADTQSANCTGLPANAVWNTVSSITQTWNGYAWSPSKAGTYNEEASTAECRYKCDTDYHWENGNCIFNTKTNIACSEIPENAQWNSVSEITQTWNGEEWIPSAESEYNEEESESECRFICNDERHYEDSTCALNTRTADCTGLPANAQWNTASTITQNWDGSAWTPTTTGSFSSTPSATECKFKCKTNYTWDQETSTCKADSKVSNCTGLPTNAEWNTVSTISQTWNGSSWQPSTTGVFSATASTMNCYFKCKTNYTWQASSSTCKADSKVSSCTGLADNAVWNTASSITQTWNGYNWSPSTEGTYNEEASTTECRYRCADTYHWETSLFFGSRCVSNTRTASCTGLPTGGVWNTASSITQNWDGSAWTPSTTGVYNTTASTTQCRYKCAQNYTWNNSTCKANTKVSNCEGLPANAAWNTVSTITQTWNGSTWMPSTTGTYNETASDTQCRYKCTSGHLWNGSKCIKNVPARICTGLNKCYNGSSEINCPAEGGNFFGQDTQYAELGFCIQRDFNFSIDTSVTNEETVIDNNTGLEWQKSSSAPSMGQTYDSANSYCSNLTFAGHSDWRLPKTQELLSIFDNIKGSLNTVFVNNATIWASPKIPTTYQAREFNEKTGYAGLSNLHHSDYTTVNLNYRCVRGSGNFTQSTSFTSSTINGDTIVTDPQTELIWQNSYVSGKNWQQALSYCENLTYAGYSDWRLPNKNELVSLVNFSSNSFPSSKFPEIPATNEHYFLSSTTTSTGYARCVGLYYGVLSTCSKTGQNYVRCVRSNE